MSQGAITIGRDIRPGAGPATAARFGLAGAVIAGLLWLAVANPYDKAFENRTLGLAIIVLGLAPAWRWLQDPRRADVPLLAIMGAFYAVCYGVAGLLTPRWYISGLQVTEAEYTPALIAALVSLLAIYAGFGIAARGSPARQAHAGPSTVGAAADKVVLFVLFPLLLVAKLVIQELGIGGLSNIIQVFSLQVFCWVSYATFLGRYTGRSRVFAWAAIAAQALAYGNVLSGVLFGLVTVALVVGLSYVAATRRIPMIALVGAVVAALFLQLGKADYRTWAWGRAENSSVATKLERFYNLSSHRLASAGIGPAINDAYTRYNFLHLSAAVMAHTPESQPFLGGETYLPILTKWIPRVLWPGKPVENTGNSWAKPYGFLPAADNATSLNLPWLPEMFMNFGWLGVIGVSGIVGALAGFLFRHMMVHALEPERFSVGVVMALPLAVPESNMSIAVGMLVITFVCVQVLSFGLAATGLKRG